MCVSCVEKVIIICVRQIGSGKKILLLNWCSTGMIGNMSLIFWLINE